MKIFPLAALLGLGLAGCASEPTTSDYLGDAAFTAEDPRRGEEVDRICFANSIRSFGETSDRTVVVRKAVNDYYLIQTFGGCFDLDQAQSLALDTFSGCLTRGDDILAFDSPFGPDRTGPRTFPCKIDKIYKWDNEFELPIESEDESES